MLNGKTVLITGGTGSFGQRFTEIVLREYSPKRLIVFSRDELKQSEMSLRFGEEEFPNIRYFIGDVRDRDRLYRAFDGVDIVVHAAALKQVLAAEYNPIEAVKTNVLGAANVIDAAIDRGVDKVIALSTDKAAGPVSLYGATKLCSDKLFVAANSYSGQHRTRFSVVRYGNVLGSRGSVIPFFQQQQKTGRLSITDPRMTRFWITLEQGVKFVLSCLGHMAGGEIFVPKIPSMKLIDLARVIGPDCEFEVVGRRPGEKLHELMVGEDDAHNTLEYDNYYAIHPTVRVWSKNEPPSTNGGRPCPEGFRYSSETNDQWLTVAELERMIDQTKPEAH